MDHGGNPNLVAKGLLPSEGTPLFTVIFGSAKDKAEKLQSLIKLGANVDHIDGVGHTAPMSAIAQGDYDLALLLLEAGANHKHVNPNWHGKYRLAHYVRLDLSRKPRWSDQQAKDYEKLVAWMEAHGESMEKAQKELDQMPRP